jgi:hypothetical protein
MKREGRPTAVTGIEGEDKYVPGVFLISCLSGFPKHPNLSFRSRDMEYDLRIQAPCGSKGLKSVVNCQQASRPSLPLISRQRLLVPR